MWRTFINKNPEALSKSDIIAIREELDKLTAWPWTLKSAREINKAGDLEFVAKAPEIIAKLCLWIDMLIYPQEKQETRNDY